MQPIAWGGFHARGQETSIGERRWVGCTFQTSSSQPSCRCPRGVRGGAGMQIFFCSPTKPGWTQKKWVTNGLGESSGSSSCWPRSSFDLLSSHAKILHGPLQLLSLSLRVSFPTTPKTSFLTSFSGVMVHKLPLDGFFAPLLLNPIVNSHHPQNVREMFPHRSLTLSPLPSFF